MFIIVEDKNRYKMITIMESVRYDPENDILYLQVKGMHTILKIDKDNLDIQKMDHEYYINSMDMYNYNSEYGSAPAHMLYNFIKG